MAFSQQRLAKALAVTRIVVGILFLALGQYKVASIDYARGAFQQQLDASVSGEAAGFYRPFLAHFIEPNAGQVAVMLGFGELFIGVGLVLGLAVRPMSALGMFYMLNLMLASWLHAGLDASFLRHFADQSPQVCLFLLFLLIGLGHAGETWGLGTLYHHRVQAGRARAQQYRGLGWEEEGGEAAVLDQEHESEFPPALAGEDLSEDDWTAEEERETTGATEPGSEQVSEEAGDPHGDFRA